MTIASALLKSKLIRHSPSPLLVHLFSSCTSPPTFDSIFRHHPPYHHRNPQLAFTHYSCRQFSDEPHLSQMEEPLLPIRILISLLDDYHNYTGFPWWIIISSSTMAMRLSLLPLTVLQIKKLTRIGQILPKLPPPLPPPLSGRSIRDRIALFQREKQASGCPSFFWFFAPFTVQVPCFFLWIVSIRRMSLDQHAGFDCGGILWFHNLTEYPHGVLGPIFPLLIAGLHFTNVQISMKTSASQQLPGVLELLAKGYKFYLKLLTLPILFFTLNVPQGSLVYWLTNSTLTLIQQLCLQNPRILKYLGLPARSASPADPTRKKVGIDKIFISTKQGKVSAETLSPKELVAFSVKLLSDGHEDPAVKILRHALEKDPGYVRAMLILGQLLLRKQLLAEASEHLERAVSELRVAGIPTEVEELDLLILSSQWAGIACIRQGKIDEGLQHLERLAEMKEPEDLKTRAHYYDGLVFLASALLNMGRNAEALKYLRKAVDYDPAYHVYLKQCEDDFAGDLAKSKRDF